MGICYFRNEKQREERKKGMRNEIVEGIFKIKQTQHDNLGS